MLASTWDSVHRTPPKWRIITKSTSHEATAYCSRKREEFGFSLSFHLDNIQAATGSSLHVILDKKKISKNLLVTTHLYGDVQGVNVNIRWMFGVTVLRKSIGLAGLEIRMIPKKVVQFFSFFFFISLRLSRSSAPRTIAARY